MCAAYCPYSTLPSRTLPLQAPQAPLRQPYGSVMPLRIAASRTPSPVSELKIRLLGLMVIRKGIRHAPEAAGPTSSSTKIAGMRRLLIVGCGDVALRIVKLLRGRYRLYALSHSAQRYDLLRAHGIVPLPGDLDQPGQLARLAGLPHDILHFAPPPRQGERDLRTGNLIRALQQSPSIPQRLVYISTSGVYGNCAGDVVEEHRPLSPSSARARRRAHAESILRAWGMRSGVRGIILRVPGIYAADRLPLSRIELATPTLLEAEDPYTNHIHADDLARIVLAALTRGRAGRVYNASDGGWLKMGDYFDLVAE